MAECSCEEIRQMLEELLSQMATRRIRSKRAPSAYNLFMRDCIKGKSGPIQQRFKACALEYKQRKERGR